MSDTLDHPASALAGLDFDLPCERPLHVPVSGPAAYMSHGTCPECWEPVLRRYCAPCLAALHVAGTVRHDPVRGGCGGAGTPDEWDFWELAL